MENSTAKSSKKSWKTKAVERNKIINAKDKRLKEVLESRDYWKAQYRILQQSERELRSLHKGNTPKYHHYCSLFIALCVEMHAYGGMSLRCCRHCLSSLVLIFGFNFRVPSHVSIRNWVCKAGYSRVYNSCFEDAPSKEDYAIWIDESLMIGSEKVLLVVGIPLNKLPTTRAVSLSDVRVLCVEVGQQWLGEDIASVLADLSSKINMRYMVSDGGHNLRRAAILGNYQQVQDCTHWVAGILEKMYSKDENFRAFANLTGSLRQKWFSSKKAVYLPPKQNTKLRFANIFPLVDWAEKMLLKWGSLPEQVQKACEWLLENRDFIEQLIVVRKHCKTILGILKNEGFNNAIYQRILAFIGVDSTDVRKEKEAYFYQQITFYLQHLVTLQAKIEISEDASLLCCSDIIESIFGKFKQKLNKRNTSNMTEFVFTIANFGHHFTAMELDNALEKVSLQTLKDWKIANKNKRQTTYKNP